MKNKKLLIGFIIAWTILFGYGIYKHGHTRNVQPEAPKRAIVKKVDPRIKILEGFFNKYNSPLSNYAKDFIEASDRYSLDFRLLPSIGGVESTFETRGNIYDNNPFGYLCNGKPCYFDNQKEAIYRVAKTLGESKTYKGFRETKSIYVLAVKYNQVEPEKWTRGINYFIKLIK